jgi:hypothetical protein
MVEAIMSKELRSIPLRNYIILFIVIIFTIFLTFYIKNMIKSYNNAELSISPLHGNISEINTNEMDLTLSESNQVILYVSYINDVSVYKMEKKLLSKIKSKNLSDYIIYYNITDMLSNEKYIDILKSKLPDIKENIKKAPLLIYIKNGKGIEVINSTNNIIDSNDLMNLVNKYEIGK